MRTTLLLLSLVLLLPACGGDEAPVEPELTPMEAVTPPPGAYPEDPLTAPPPQPPLPEGEAVAEPVEVQPTPPPVEAAPQTETPRATKTAPPVAAVPNAELGPLTVTEVVLAKAISDRQPSGVSSTFTDGDKVNCFTRFDNPQGHTRGIQHRYYFGDELKRTIDLKVKSTTWRTWSTKTVFGRGNWRVDITDPAGTVLKSVPFVVE